MDNQQLVDLKNILLSLQYKDENEEIDILRKSILLNDIHFPKLHQAFRNRSDVKYTAFWANTFSCFIDLVVSSSRLIIDEFIEKIFWGEDWENTFLNTRGSTNIMRISYAKDLRLYLYLEAGATNLSGTIFWYQNDTLPES